jgi:putative hemolysin
VSKEVALGLLLLAVAWLTAASIAVRSVSRIWLRHWVERRLSGSDVAEIYLERPQRLLLAGGCGVAISVFSAGMILGANRGHGLLDIALRLAGASVVVLFIGQLIPRALGRRFAVRLVPALLPVLRAVEILMWPLLGVARRVVRRRARERGASAEPASREHIEDLLREGELEGVGASDESAIISGVVSFGDKLVADVMTPRDDVYAVEASTPPAELARGVAHNQYSRVPVYRGTIDEVVGMVHVFDVLKEAGETFPRLRPVASAEPRTRCNDLLFTMLRKRMHLAVVRDPAAGRTLGIVTLEDLLEELVGDIRDEHDEPDPAAGPRPAATASSSAPAMPGGA